MATPIIPISFDSSEESVAAAIVASPTGVLDLDVHSTSETDPFKDLSSPVHAPAAPIISLFLHSSDSFEASEDSSGGDSFKSLSLLDSHEETPFGLPYHTHPNRVLRMLTARKIVHLYLARIPMNRKGFHSSSSSPPRKRYITSLYLSSSDSPGSTADDSPVPHKFVDPHPVRTLRDNKAYRRWRDTPLYIMYPPTTFKSSSRDFSFDSSTSSSKSPPHSSATHSPTPSPFVGPSRKRCTSLTTSVPLATPTPGVLSPAFADLLPPRKRIRGFLATSSLEDGSKGSMEVGSEEDIDSDVMANIEANIVAEAATDDEIKAETEVGLERDDEAEDEAESSARGTIE
ncbi:hypothetical protein Tco_1552034, partial [Tanacetum coccineum]